MLLGKLNYYENNKVLNDRINFAINFLKTENLSLLPAGKTVINENFFLQNLSYNTEDENNFKFETHKKWLDLHYILEGKEKIVITDVNNISICSEYNPERDIIFYSDSKDSKEIILQAGEYLLIEKDEAHKTNCNINGISSFVKKLL